MQSETVDNRESTLLSNSKTGGDSQTPDQAHQIEDDIPGAVPTWSEATRRR